MTTTRFDRGSTRIDYFADLDRTVAMALSEDLGSGDLTALLVPADLAYGDGGAGSTIPPGATLIFDVELLEIVP